MPTQVTLTRYAELRADMESGVLRDEALLHAGLSADEWTVAQREWLERMGAEIERGRFELTNQYAQAFLVRQRAATARPAALAPPPRTAEALAPGLPPARTEVPSFALSPPPAPATHGTPGMPVAPHAPVIVDAPPPLPKRAPSPLAGTSMSLDVPRGPAMPFAATPAGAASATPPTPAATAVRGVPVRVPNALAGTSMALDLPKGPAIPFASATRAPSQPPPAAAPSQPPAPQAPVAAPPPSSQPVVRRPPAELAGTSMAFVAPRGPVVPFAAAAAPPPPSVDPPVAPPPSPAAPAARSAAQAAAPLQVGGLTLEQHVSLCAELTFAPARAHETLARYRVTPDAKPELDRQWRERFAADPALEARWRDAYRVYVAFLGAKRAPP